MTAQPPPLPPNRSYAIYAVGALLANTGSWVHNTSLAWLVLQVTGSGTAIGITAAATMLPILVVSPLAGSIADRASKKALLRGALTVTSGGGMVIGTLGLTGHAVAWHAYVAALIVGLGRAIEIPIRQAFVPELVDRRRVGSAVAMEAASFTAGRLTGPGLAGLCIALLGAGAEAAGWVLLVNACLIALVTLSLPWVRSVHVRPPRRGHDHGHKLTAFLRTRHDLRVILLAVLFVGTFGLNFQMTSALMATEVYGKGAAEYGVLGSTLALGSTIGALVAVNRNRPTMKIILSAGFAFSLVQIAMAFSPTYVLFVCATPLLGFCALSMLSTASSYLQVHAPSPLRGRVAGVYTMAYMGGTPIGAPFIGWIGELLGARATLYVGGSLSLLGVASATAWLGVHKRR